MRKILFFGGILIAVVSLFLSHVPPSIPIVQDLPPIHYVDGGMVQLGHKYFMFKNKKWILLAKKP